jgi:hypothetical protein
MVFHKYATSTGTITVALAGSEVSTFLRMICSVVDHTLNTLTTFCNGKYDWNAPVLYSLGAISVDVYG